MPRRSFHNQAADNRPAFGLLDDVLDEKLRASTAGPEDREARQQPRKQRRGVIDEDVDAVDAGRVDYLRLLAEGRRLQHPAHDWRDSNRVTSTEVAGILGAGLLRCPELTSNVKAFLGGHELTRDERRFDVQGFLRDKLHFAPKAQRKDDWRGNYSLPGIRHKLVLDLDERDPRIVVNLRGRWRMTVFFAGGGLKSDGDAEPRIVRDLVDRARKAQQRWVQTTVMDLWAVCVPRSEHFRKTILADNARDRPPGLRIVYLMAERTSATVVGLREALDIPDDDQ